MTIDSWWSARGRELSLVWGRLIGLTLSIVASWEGLRALVAFAGLLYLRGRHPNAPYLPTLHDGLVPIALSGLGVAAGLAISRATGANLDNLSVPPSTGRASRLEQSRTYLVWLRRVGFGWAFVSLWQSLKGFWGVHSITELAAPAGCCAQANIFWWGMTMLAGGFIFSEAREKLRRLDRESGAPVTKR